MGDAYGVGKNVTTTDGPQLTDAQKAAAKAAGGKQRTLKAGINNGKSLVANPTFNITEAENIIQGKEGTIIVMGRDRPGSPTSGTALLLPPMLGLLILLLDYLDL